MGQGSNEVNQQEDQININNDGNIVIEVPKTDKNATVREYQDALKNRVLELDEADMASLSRTGTVATFVDNMTEAMNAEKETFLEKAYNLVNTSDANKRVQFGDAVNNEKLDTPEKCFAHLIVNLNKLGDKNAEAAEKTRAFNNLSRISRCFDGLYNVYDFNGEYNTDEYRSLQNGRDLFDDVNLFINDSKEWLFDPLAKDEKDIDMHQRVYQQSRDQLVTETDAYLDRFGGEVYEFEAKESEKKEFGKFEASTNLDARNIVTGDVSFLEEEADRLISETNGKKKLAENVINGAEQKINAEAKKAVDEREQKFESTVNEIRNRYHEENQEYLELSEKLRGTKSVYDRENYKNFEKGLSELKNADLSKVSEEYVFIKPDTDISGNLKPVSAGTYDKSLEKIDSQIRELSDRKAANEKKLKDFDAEITGLEVAPEEKSELITNSDFAAEIADAQNKQDLLDVICGTDEKTRAAAYEEFTSAAKEQNIFTKLTEKIEDRNALKAEAEKKNAAFEDFLKTRGGNRAKTKAEKAIESFKTAQANVIDMLGLTSEGEEKQTDRKKSFGFIEDFKPFDKGEKSALALNSLGEQMSLLRKTLQDKSGELSLNGKQAAALEKFKKEIDATVKALQPILSEPVTKSAVFDQINLEMKDQSIDQTVAELRANEADRWVALNQKQEDARQQQVDVSENAKKQAAQNRIDRAADIRRDKMPLTAENDKIALNIEYLTKVKTVLETGKAWCSEPDVRRTVQKQKLQPKIDKMNAEIEAAKETCKADVQKIRDEHQLKSEGIKAQQAKLLNFCDKKIQVAQTLKENTEALKNASKQMKTGADRLAYSRETLQEKAARKSEVDREQYRKTVEKMQADRDKMMTAVLRSGKSVGKNSPYFNAVEEKINAYKAEKAKITDLNAPKTDAYNRSLEELHSALENYITNRDTHKNKFTSKGQQRLDAIKSLYANIDRMKKVEEKYASEQNRITEKLQTVEPKTYIEGKILQNLNKPGKAPMTDAEKLPGKMSTLKANYDTKILDAIREKVAELASRKQEVAKEQSIVNPSAKNTVAKKKEEVKEPIELGGLH